MQMDVNDAEGTGMQVYAERPGQVDANAAEETWYVQRWMLNRPGLHKWMQILLRRPGVQGYAERPGAQVDAKAAKRPGVQVYAERPGQVDANAARRSGVQRYAERPGAQVDAKAAK